MFTKYAFLNPNGLPAYISTSSRDNELQNGQIVDGLTLQSIPEDVDPADILENWYWENGWKKKPIKQNVYQTWDATGKLWQLNEPDIVMISRGTRNHLLSQSDWTQLPDVDLSAANKQSWKLYRQALRDMTEQDFLTGNFPVYK